MEMLAKSLEFEDLWTQIFLLAIKSISEERKYAHIDRKNVTIDSFLRVVNSHTVLRLYDIT